MLSIDQLIEHLPVTGQWHLFKTDSSTDERRYFARWSEVEGHKRTEFSCHGPTPHAALLALVLAIPGPEAFSWKFNYARNCTGKRGK